MSSYLQEGATIHGRDVRNRFGMDETRTFLFHFTLGKHYFNYFREFQLKTNMQ